MSTYRNDFIVFGYPAEWAPATFSTVGALHFTPPVYVSSQSVHAPCRTTTTSVVCGWPLRRLRPGGALIVWQNRGAPGWSLKTTNGTPVQVGGRHAKRSVSRPGRCAAIGADETIAVEIERPLPDNWTAFIACLRGPSLTVGEGEVDAMLASTRFLGP